MGKYDDRMIYAYWPADYRSPEEAVACYHPDRIEDPTRLKPTGWMLDDNLIGSVWCNLHVGWETTAAFVGEKNGEPNLFETNRWGSNYSLGMWRPVEGHAGYCFIMEHWARVDHLGQKMRLAWYGIELAHYRAEIERHERAAVNYADTRKYPKHYEQNEREQVAQARIALDAAIRAARAYAHAHHLVIDMDILNAGLVAGQQMALF